MTSKFALVIANTEYQDKGFSKLTAPGRDAEEFARVLKQPNLAAFNDVQVLLNKSESDIRRAIARFFGNRKLDDLLLLYFSGHGVRSEQGQLFLAASDTEMSILEVTGVPTELITHTMNSSRSQRQVLILDCCNSGAFDRGAKSASNMGMGQAFEGGFGRIVLTATDAVQFAWEGDKVIGYTQNSVFTHFLIEGLNGEADRNGDGKISVDELYDYAYEQVVKHTPKQTPSKWSYKQQGDIFLRENLKPRVDTTHKPIEARSPEEELLEQGCENWKTKDILIGKDALKVILRQFDNLNINQDALKLLIYSSAESFGDKKQMKKLTSKLSPETRGEILHEWVPKLYGKNTDETKKAERILFPFWARLPFLTGQRIFLKNVLAENKDRVVYFTISLIALIIFTLLTVSIEPKNDWVPLASSTAECKINQSNPVTLIDSDFVGQNTDIVFLDSEGNRFCVSRDNSKSWTTILPPVKDFVREVRIVGGNLLVSTNNQIWLKRTGTDWIELNLPTAPAPRSVNFSINSANPVEIWLYTGNGILYRTSNQGADWSDTAHTDLNELTALSSNNKYLVLAAKQSLVVYNLETKTFVGINTWGEIEDDIIGAYPYDPNGGLFYVLVENGSVYSVNIDARNLQQGGLWTKLIVRGLTVSNRNVIVVADGGIECLKTTTMYKFMNIFKWEALESSHCQE